MDMVLGKFIGEKISTQLLGEFLYKMHLKEFKLKEFSSLWMDLAFKIIGFMIRAFI